MENQKDLKPKIEQDNLATGASSVEADQASSIPNKIEPQHLGEITQSLSGTQNQADPSQYLQTEGNKDGQQILYPPQRSQQVGRASYQQPTGQAEPNLQRPYAPHNQQVPNRPPVPQSALPYSPQGQADYQQAALNQPYYQTQNMHRQPMPYAQQRNQQIPNRPPVQQNPLYPQQSIQRPQMPYQQPMPYYGPNKANKKESFEQRFGGKITNVIGISFMLLAVIFGLYYTYTILESNLIKSIIAYAVGGLFLGVGELFNRKSKSGINYFSLGLCAGGVSILFATTAISYFELNVLSIPGAFISCAVVFLLAIFLSLRYDAQLIGVFAVIGGFMPILALEPGLTLVLVCMCYFLILNILVLLLANRKNWTVIKFFSLILSLACSFYMLDQAEITSIVLISGYLLLNWLLYLAVILVRPLKLENKLQVSDLILVGINTLFSFVLIEQSIRDIIGRSPIWMVGIIFATLYFAIYFVWQYNVKDDKRAHIFFLTTATLLLLYGTLLKFDHIDLALVVGLEGLLMLVISVIRNDKYFKAVGAGLAGLGIASFLLYHADYLMSPFGFERYRDYDSYFADQLVFILKYLSIIIGIFAILLTIKVKNRNVKHFLSYRQSDSIEAIRGAALLGVWSLLALVAEFSLIHLPEIISTFWINYTICFITLILVLINQKASFYKTGFVKTIIVIQSIYAGLCLVFSINFSEVVRLYAQNTGLKVATIIAVCLINIVAVYNLYVILESFIKNKKDQKNYLPVIISLVSLFLTYSICRYHILGSKSILLSILVLLWALGMIVYGFVKNAKILRLIGLGLSIGAVFKFFVLDLFYLVGWQKALSYAAVGLIFILISFAYQHFSGKILSAKKGTAQMRESTSQTAVIPRSTIEPVVNTISDEMEAMSTEAEETTQLEPFDSATTDAQSLKEDTEVKIVAETSKDREAHTEEIRDSLKAVPEPDDVEEE